MTLNRNKSGDISFFSISCFTVIHFYSEVALNICIYVQEKIEKKVEQNGNMTCERESRDKQRGSKSIEFNQFVRVCKKERSAVHVHVSV